MQIVDNIYDNIFNCYKKGGVKSCNIDLLIKFIMSFPEDFAIDLQKEDAIKGNNIGGFDISIFRKNKFATYCLFTACVDSESQIIWSFTSNLIDSETMRDLHVNDLYKPCGHFSFSAQDKNKELYYLLDKFSKEYK